MNKENAVENEQIENAFEGWVILELMGHRRLAGYLREQQIGGAAFLRIDIPSPDGKTSATQFYAPAAVYAITPTTEDLVKRLATINQPAPVTRWELPERTETAQGRVIREESELDNSGDDDQDDDDRDPVDLP